MGKFKILWENSINRTVANEPLKNIMKKTFQTFM